MSLLQTLSDGLRESEWVGVLLARLSVGLLFVLTGQGKLFRPSRREQLLKTLVEARIPFAPFTALAVSCVEFVFGALLLIGALTPLACAMLGANMLVALATVQVRTIHASSAGDWLSDFLYLPEVLYLVLLVWLFFSGPGWLSVDHLLLGLSTF